MFMESLGVVLRNETHADLSQQMHAWLQRPSDVEFPSLCHGEAPNGCCSTLDPARCAFIATKVVEYFLALDTATRLIQVTTFFP
jgi:hypothetical protein